MKTENTALKNTENILIVGLGLIGGSYAKALTKQGFRVRAVTKRQEDIDYAVEHGFLAEGHCGAHGLARRGGYRGAGAVSAHPHRLGDPKR